jgi:hypothetical protein
MGHKGKEQSQSYLSCESLASWTRETRETRERNCPNTLIDESLRIAIRFSPGYCHHSPIGFGGMGDRREIGGTEISN